MALHERQVLPRDQDYSFRIIFITDLNGIWSEYTFLEAKYNGISPESLGQAPSPYIFLCCPVSVVLLQYEYTNKISKFPFHLLSQCSFWKAMYTITELYQAFFLVFNSQVFYYCSLEKWYLPYLFVNSYHISQGIPANSYQLWQTYLVDLCSDFDGRTDLFVLLWTKLMTLQWHLLYHWTSETLLIY